MQVLRARTLCHRVSQCVKFYPGATIAPIIMGTIGGSGGKVISDMIRGGYGLTTGRDEMSMPTFSVQSGVFCAFVYYWLVHISTSLTAMQGSTLITLLLVCCPLWYFFWLTGEFSYTFILYTYLNARTFAKLGFMSLHHMISTAWSKGNTASNCSHRDLIMLHFLLSILLKNWWQKVSFGCLQFIW